MYLFFAILFMFWQALSGPAQVNYQGRIFDSSGDPVDSGDINVITQILDPSGQCLLYEESHGISMTESSGFFTVNIGAGTQNTATAPNFSLTESLSNATSLNSANVGCSVNSSNADTYVPNSSDARLLRVSINGETLSPDQSIQTVPYSLYANESSTVGGKSYTEIKTYADENFGGNALPDLSSIGSGQSVRWGAGGWELFTPGTSSVTAGNGLEVSGSDFLVKAGTNISVNATGVHVDSTNLDADQLDGQEGSYYLSWSNFTGIPSALSDGQINWSELQSVPADIADGDADTLAGLSCGANQIARFVSGSWQCADNISGTASNVTGTVAVANGGTGQTATPTNGQLLIGNGTGYTVANLTAGTGVTITNNAGSITISAASGSSGLRSCDTGNANDVMVEVGSWCVDKYEASVWSGSDGTGTDYFTDSTTGGDTDANYPTGAANVPSGCNRNGSGCNQYAVSKPGVIPSRGVTWYQAARFCANAGKVLIPDGLWQTAAIGTNDPGSGSGTGGSAGGSATDAAAAQCNINTHNSTWTSWLKTNNGVRPTNRAGQTSGGTNACISDFGVEDMVGNLWEWTDANGIPAGEDQSAFTQGESNSSGGPFSTADGSWNINGSAYGCDGPGSTKGTCGWKNNVAAAALRGGGWSSGTHAGVTALTLSDSGSYSSWSIGFRCARSR